MHAKIIQKYLRGYYVSQKLVQKMRREKLAKNLGYFERMKLKLQSEAVIKIQIQVRKFL